MFQINLHLFHQPRLANGTLLIDATSAASCGATSIESFITSVAPAAWGFKMRDLTEHH